MLLRTLHTIEYFNVASVCCNWNKIKAGWNWQNQLFRNPPGDVVQCSPTTGAKSGDISLLLFYCLGTRRSLESIFWSQSRAEKVQIFLLATNAKSPGILICNCFILECSQLHSVVNVIRKSTFKCSHKCTNRVEKDKFK